MTPLPLNVAGVLKYLERYGVKYNINYWQNKYLGIPFSGRFNIKFGQKTNRYCPNPGLNCPHFQSKTAQNRGAWLRRPCKHLTQTIVIKRKQL